MGVVRCQRHGRQSGVMCRNHIDLAIKERSLKDGVAEVVIDLMDDGAIPISTLLCTQCAKVYEVRDGQTVEGECLEMWKDLTIQCPECLAEAQLVLAAEQAVRDSDSARDQ